VAAAADQVLQVERARPVQWAVRAGFIARGVTYGVIGVLALALALRWGSAGAAPNQQGALTVIARAPLGRLAIAVVAVGLLAYALWKLVQGIRGRGPEGGGGPGLMDRAANLGGGVVYVAFFVVAVRVLLGSSGSDQGAPRHAAAGVLGWPGGQLIVGIAGAGLVAISAFQIYDAVTGHFADNSKVAEMGDGELRLFLLAGIVGLTARALVFALIGYFLVRTAIDFHPASAVGVDGALAHIRRATYGPTLLVLVAAGLLIFASFSLLEARYRRL
jgi:Domain of Unknown Function (DUF1206)